MALTVMVWAVMAKVDRDDPSRDGTMMDRDGLAVMASSRDGLQS